MGVTPPPWTGPAVGLMDLDAFFASVEMLDHPEWRGKPLIVGGDADSRGVVSTCSYEARRFGVHSAMASAEARRLCPQAIWTHGHFDRYREVSAQVMAILAEETPRVERVSIDEAFIDITPGRFAPEDPLLVARRISDRVAALGVTCSIGVGCNKTVAKIASERDKPFGLTIVRPGTEQRFLAALPVSAMSGIGRSAEERLRRMRIYTLGELSRAPESTLASIFGVNGERMRQRALGLEISEVTSLDEEREVKSVSNERTFAKDLTERGDIEAAIALLGESVGRRLRRQGLTGATVTLKLKYSYGSGRTAQRRLPHPTDDENIFVAGRHACSLSRHRHERLRPPRRHPDRLVLRSRRPRSPIQRPPRALRRDRRRPRQVRRHRPIFRPPIPLQRLTAFEQKESRAGTENRNCPAKCARLTKSPVSNEPLKEVEGELGGVTPELF